MRSSTEGARCCSSSAADPPQRTVKVPSSRLPPFLPWGKASLIGRLEAASAAPAISAQWVNSPASAKPLLPSACLARAGTSAASATIAMRRGLGSGWAGFWGAVSGFFAMPGQFMVRE